jgi:hypothetical protein
MKRALYHADLKGDSPMKQMWTTSFLLCFMALASTAVAKEKAWSAVDMTNVKRVFIGWAAIDANYHKLGYGTLQDWNPVVRDANAHFIEMLKSSNLGAGRELVGATSPEDTAVNGYDLYIKPVDASFDYGYRLHIGFDLVNTKTGAILLHMDTKRYGAHLCGLTGCMDKEFDEAVKDINSRLGL